MPHPACRDSGAALRPSDPASPPGTQPLGLPPCAYLVLAAAAPEVDAPGARMRPWPLSGLLGDSERWGADTG